MISYRAMYKYLDDCVHAEVLDFPGVISAGRDLEEARRLLEALYRHGRRIFASWRVAATTESFGDRCGE